MNEWFTCRDERRRNAVRAHPTLNGIDFLEVVDSSAASDADRQRVLRIHFLKVRSGAPLTPANVRLRGGERVRSIVVTGVEQLAQDPASIVTVHVSRPGDFATYTLALVQGPGSDAPPPDLDPMLAEIDFTFKIECPGDFDPLPALPLPPPPGVAPRLDYLAKDYASIRRAMLDRLAVLAPAWQGQEIGDLGMVLVELLAYTADHLSYAQDAVATEAYLGTARRRVSVRRHTRLVDYVMHDGANARVWAHVQVTGRVTLARGTQLLTRGSQPEVFETMHAATLVPDHNRLIFYTWGAAECCLPAGTTRATLRGNLPDLHVGDVLVFVEARDPSSGEPVGADPAKRHAVRLTLVEAMVDPLGGRFADPPVDTPVPVTTIAWGDADALPFELCTSIASPSGVIDDVSIALGNIVLADHGQRTTAALGTVFDTRFRPLLPDTDLTQAVPYDAAHPPASAFAATSVDPRSAQPAIALQSQFGETTASWTPRLDLLGSGSSARDFVVETESDGGAFIRFGDDQFGLRPASGTAFAATYRVGNGTRGNIGAGALASVVTTDDGVESVTNPLPARGGVDAESAEEARQKAPFAFRVSERAVIPADYAEIVERHPGVQRAAGTARWTGAWQTIFVSVDRLGSQDLDADFRAELLAYLEPFRRAGQDVQIEAPRFVPLEIVLNVCVAAGYLRRDVRTALLDVFSQVRRDGRPGLFHPDNFTFGQPVYLSPLYAAARAVAGVDDVQVTVFQRQGSADRSGLDTGFLTLHRLEIARLDNSPDFPEHGVFRLTLEGGQ